MYFSLWDFFYELMAIDHQESKHSIVSKSFNSIYATLSMENFEVLTSQSRQCVLQTNCFKNDELDCLDPL